jgi:hypothetical protein
LCSFSFAVVPVPPPPIVECCIFSTVSSLLTSRILFSLLKNSPFVCQISLGFEAKLVMMMMLLLILLLLSSFLRCSLLSLLLRTSIFALFLLQI